MNAPEERRPIGHYYTFEDALYAFGDRFAVFAAWAEEKRTGDGDYPESPEVRVARSVAELQADFQDVVKAFERKREARVRPTARTRNVSHGRHPAEPTGRAGNGNHGSQTEEPEPDPDPDLTNVLERALGPRTDELDGIASTLEELGRSDQEVRTLGQSLRRVVLELERDLFEAVTGERRTV